MMGRPLLESRNHWGVIEGWLVITGIFLQPFTVLRRALSVDSIFPMLVRSSSGL